MSSDQKQRHGISRRTLLAASAALPLCSIISRRGYAAEFPYKMATGQDPTHPVNIRAQEACNRIREATGGRLDLQLFPANQLGSDTDLLSQLRSGAVEFFNLSASILATFAPLAGIVNTGFAFPDYKSVWSAMDGALGDHLRAQIAKTGIQAEFRLWDNGFRHVTTSTKSIQTPDDIKGLKIRVPPAPMLNSVFQSLGAAPTPINFNELYTALQTKIVEGQENPLAITATTRLYEVQKYCSMTGHVWDGYLMLANRRSWSRLPDDIKAVVSREINASGEDQRTDIAKLSVSLRDDLTGKGLQFNEVDRPAFQAALRKTPFYQSWKAKYGDEAWSLLEAISGKLA
ncbi:TRAP transporter substrate-binding protein [Telmatospirillum sp.]|uniref:TRAP transporter substrate-binding protein n=1 Tax=Telmatospirillum sp. TaxID=2079197 RepID=UPI002843BF21|nr:TRAP transporter substrate-binding protein [Telmatospirillum sp.]MDR3439760.1 TRAP transporter substrate-binding protein [Telmatospirillum sp.]